jgi:hypothetical protein
MIYGQSRFNGQLEVVQIIKLNPRNTMVRRTYKSVPIGKAIKRHNIKHHVKIHGKNIIRKDWIK